MIVIKKGIRIVSTIPLKTDIMAYSAPMYFVITGRQVSIDVAPPDEIGASFPKYLAKIGVNSKVIISRMILESKAITPSCSPDISEINTLERL